MLKSATIIIFFILLTGAAYAVDGRLAVAVVNAPVLNRPDFKAVFGGRDGNSLLTDRCGQIRAVEFIAMKGTLFRIEEELSAGSANVYRVTTNDYPCPVTSGCFVDARSVAITTGNPGRPKSLPARQQILANLEKRVGSRYIWGGNVAAGVQELTRWYSPAAGSDRKLWQLAGLDCSGLLYEATDGYTPRNTSDLVSFGTAVKIAGKSPAEIGAVLEPLDLVVWPGHVMIVLSGSRIIESRLVCGRPEEGVRIRPLQSALKELAQSRRPVDVPAKGSKEYGIRRWYQTGAVTP